MTIPAPDIPASAVTRQPWTPGRQAATADDPSAEHPVFADVLHEQAAAAGGSGTADVPSTTEPPPDAPGAWLAQLAFATAITPGAPGEARRTPLLRAAPEQAHAGRVEARAQPRWPAATRGTAAVSEAPELAPARMAARQSGDREGSQPTPGQPLAGAVTGGDGAMTLANAPPPTPAQQIIALLRKEVQEVITMRAEPITGQPVRQLRLRLQPDGLGEVHISLRMTRTRLTVDIRAERADAARMLGRDSGALSAALSGPDIVESSCSVHISVGALAGGAVQAASAAGTSGMADVGQAQHGGEGSGQGGHQHRQPQGEPHEHTAQPQPRPHSGAGSLLVL